MASIKGKPRRFTLFRSLIGVAFGALAGNKLRSGLTFLGVVFGVTSVMTIFSALEGMMGAIEEQLATLGPSTFMVSKHLIIQSEEEWLEKRKRKPIDLRAARMVVRDCQQCAEVSPRTFTEARLKYQDKSLRDIGIMGGTSNFVDIVDFEVGIGRFHTTEDDLYKRNVVFIGEDVRKAFFEGTDCLDKVIKLDGQKYTVIGVAKSRGAMFGESQDNFCVIPLSTFIGQYGESRYGLNLVIKAKSVAVLEDTMDEVRMLLRSHRNVPYDKPDDFDMLTAESALDLLNQMTKMFRLVVIGISCISLVIGGIVVMNIMMVAVTERTREIGIRKSLGAKFSHIAWQFLMEAIMLTVSGGLVGILAGFMIAKALVGMMDMQISPSPMAIGAGLTISTLVGIIAGVYPALKAAKLAPVKALRYE
jgi:putative ABC transport system permease protein